MPKKKPESKPEVKKESRLIPEVAAEPKPEIPMEDLSENLLSDDGNSPFEDILSTLQSPSSNMTPEEKQTVKELTLDSSSSIKQSLVGLLMGQFNKVSAYNQQADAVLRMVIERARTMENNELIQLLSVLTRVSSTEAKSILEMFKKNESSIQKIMIDINTGGDGSGTKKDSASQESSVIPIRPEIADRMLRLMEKFSAQEEVQKKKIIDVKPEDINENDM